MKEGINISHLVGEYNWVKNDIEAQYMTSFNLVLKQDKTFIFIHSEDLGSTIFEGKWSLKKIPEPVLLNEDPKNRIVLYSEKKIVQPGNQTEASEYTIEFYFYRVQEFILLLQPNKIPFVFKKRITNPG